MKRIAILGCENSHANSFLNYIRDRKEFSDVYVVGVYSDEEAASAKLHDTYGVPVMKSFDEAVGKIDGLMITARHGDNHYKYAKPYIKSGIPMFIDKPITVSEADAVDFMKELKENGVRITGGSSLRHDKSVMAMRDEFLGNCDTVGGFVSAPIAKSSPYGGFFFYAQHLVEMVGEIFGKYPKSVLATEKEKQITVIFRYDGFDCVGNYVEGSSVYLVSAMTKKVQKTLECKLSADNDWFLSEFSEFYALLNGENSKIAYDDFISPVFVMNAIDRSLRSQKEEAVNRYSLN